MKKILIIVFVVIVIFLIRLFMLGIESQNNSPLLGHVQGKLTPCPDKPNCVSSFAQDIHKIDPINGTHEVTELKSVILSIGGAKLEQEEENYLRFSFESKIFKFVDDLELYKTDGFWHVRSASRVGHSDMDANRKRVEKIRKTLKSK